MDVLLFVKAASLGAVEGLTEFLPISSTGHLIIASDLIDFAGDFATTFSIAIQAGAICAVCWHYRTRLTKLLSAAFTKEKSLAINLIVAVIPAGILGLIAHAFIEAHLFNVFTVAIALIVGGFLIFWVEKRAEDVTPSVQEMDAIDASMAFKIGCMQCLALIPGMSRSGATIIGAMYLGLARKAATEFSFFLAIPTIFAATGYSLISAFLENETIFTNASHASAFCVGFAMSFVSAIFVVKWLLKYVSTNSFNAFGWYRIFFGAMLLTYHYF